MRQLQVASDAADIHSDDDEAGITDDDYYDDYDNAGPVYSSPATVINSYLIPYYLFPPPLLVFIDFVGAYCIDNFVHI